MELILASSSPFRKELLNKLGLKFSTYSPNIDESVKAGESPKQLVYRLSQEKAYAATKKHSGLIIASDQVAVLENKILNKPSNHKNAVEQLKQSSGKSVTFLTSLTLLNTNTSNMQTIVEKYKVNFKNLSIKQIENYLKKDKPYNCAGSFKSESLGIILFKSLDGDDPNTLIGLPIIRLIKMLEKEGIDVLSLP